jgi:hypothetical protein
VAVQVFISYARNDDQLPRGFEGKQGFVTYLHNQLEYEFKEFGNPRPRLWRDTHAIDGGDAFGPVIEENLDKSDMLLVVLSRNWLDSSWCREELERFGRRWRQSEGLDRARERIVFLSKHHIPIANRPELLQGKTGFDFYVFDQEAGQRHEEEFFKRGEPRDGRYFDRVAAVASYLWRYAERLTNASSSIPEKEPEKQDNRGSPRIGKSGAGGSVIDDEPGGSATANGRDPNSKPAPSRIVYVAKPAADMRQAYERVVAELEGRGFGVVPEKGAAIPSDEKATSFIDAALKSADLSIHLLGEKEGYRPEDADAPIMPLQLARAAARPAAKGDRPFYRIIWAPRSLAAEDESETAVSIRDPLAVVEKFGAQLPSDKIDGDSLSKFVDFLIQHVDRTTMPSDDFDRLEADMRVYVYHQRQDFDYARLVKNRLRERQIDILPTVFEGDAAQIDALHRNHLKECDGVVLVWARAPDSWVYARSRELRSWLELGRKREFAVRGLIAAPPPGDEKKDMLDFPPRKEIDITIDVTKFDDPPPEAIDKLIKAVRPAAP